MGDFAKSIEVVTKSEKFPTIKFYPNKFADGSEVLLVCVEVKTEDGQVIEQIRTLNEVLDEPSCAALLPLLAEVHMNALILMGFESKPGEPK